MTDREPISSSESMGIRHSEGVFRSVGGSLGLSGTFFYKKEGREFVQFPLDERRVMNDLLKVFVLIKNKIRRMVQQIGQ